jgi:hypothetical protein
MSNPLDNEDHRVFIAQMRAVEESFERDLIARYRHHGWPDRIVEGALLAGVACGLAWQSWDATRRAAWRSVFHGAARLAGSLDRRLIR